MTNRSDCCGGVHGRVGELTRGRFEEETALETRFHRSRSSVRVVNTHAPQNILLGALLCVRELLPPADRSTTTGGGEGSRHRPLGISRAVPVVVASVVTSPRNAAAAAAVVRPIDGRWRLDRRPRWVLRVNKPNRTRPRREDDAAAARRPPVSHRTRIRLYRRSVV